MSDLLFKRQDSRFCSYTSREGVPVLSGKILKSVSSPYVVVFGVASLRIFVPLSE